MQRDFLFVLFTYLFIWGKAYGSLFTYTRACVDRGVKTEDKKDTSWLFCPDPVCAILLQ